MSSCDEQRMLHNHDLQRFCRMMQIALFQNEFDLLHSFNTCAYSLVPTAIDYIRRLVKVLFSYLTWFNFPTLTLLYFAMATLQGKQAAELTQMQICHNCLSHTEATVLVKG